MEGEINPVAAFVGWGYRFFFGQMSLDMGRFWDILNMDIILSLARLAGWSLEMRMNRGAGLD